MTTEKEKYPHDLRDINQFLEPNEEFMLSPFEKNQLSTVYDKSGMIDFFDLYKDKKFTVYFKKMLLKEKMIKQKNGLNMSPVTVKMKTH